MKFFWKLTMVIVGMVVTLIFSVTYYVYLSTKVILEKEIITKIEDRAIHTMNLIDRILFERFIDIKDLATDPVICSPTSTPLELTTRLIQYRNAHKTYISLSLFDLNRVRIADTAGLNLGEKQPFTAFWVDIFQGKISIATNIQIAEDLLVPVIYFASPVRDKMGRTFAVVVSRMPVAMLYDITRQTTGIYTEEGSFQVDLVNQSGRLLYSNYNRKGILVDRVTIPQSDTGTGKDSSTGSGRLLESGKEESISVYAREVGYLDFPGNGWILMIRVPTRVAFVPAIELRNKIFFLVFPFLVLSVTIILLFSRTISRPLVQLSRAAQEIGEGHLDVRVNIRSRDEIGQLAKEFERMVLNLQKTTTSITNLEREISERRRVENALQQERDFDQSLIETAQVIILVLDIEGRIVLFNPFLEDISGYRLLDVKGKNWFSLFISLEDRDVVRSVFQEVLKTPGTVQAENQIVTREGRRREISWNSKTMKDVKGKTIGLLSIGQDVTERKKAEEFIRKMAFHDFLTGLPNRKLFQERLTQELARARRKMETVAIMFLDLDGFKTINDTYGHEIGDKVLCEVARRLEHIKRESDIACRLGGDEFTLLLTGMNSPEDALGIARRLLDIIRNPVEIGGHTFFISVSIGISFCPANGTDPETLVKRADEAMYLAKTRGKDQFQVSSEEGTLP